MTHRVILHPGFSKTATTLLQERVFGRLPGVRCLGKPDFGRACGVTDHASWKDSLSGLRDLPSVRYRHGNVRESWLRTVRSQSGKGDATILFTLREQSDWVFSLYTDSVRRRGLREKVGEWLSEGLSRPA